MFLASMATHIGMCLLSVLTSREVVARRHTGFFFPGVTSRCKTEKKAALFRSPNNIIANQNLSFRRKNKLVRYPVRMLAAIADENDSDDTDKITTTNDWIYEDSEDDFSGDAPELWSIDGSGTTDPWSQQLNADENVNFSQTDGAEDSVSISDFSSMALSDDDVDYSENWLDALAAVAREEVSFIENDAERAEKAREMQDLGFTPKQISGALNVATSSELEDEEAGEEFVDFQKATSGAAGGFGMVTYDEDEIDKELRESHKSVERGENGELIRTQMVYVDEVTCIGCYNCAMIAQSTFFMEPEHGRARVFEQWGDDDETIQVAIETCPVDCIHYIPYDELERLEIERRGQNINFKARLVNQGEYGGGTGHRVGGNGFTGAQVISGNLGNRCNNCPSRGCQNCPMYGVGMNPDFQKKEDERKSRKKEKQLKDQLEQLDRSAEL